MFGYLIRHDNFLKTIAEVQIGAKKSRGRPRRAYIDQLNVKVNVGS